MRFAYEISFVTGIHFVVAAGTLEDAIAQARILHPGILLRATTRIAEFVEATPPFRAPRVSA